MAHIATNRGLNHIATNDMSTADIRAAVFVGAGPADATIYDYNFLSDLTGAMTEAAVANYARLDFANVGVTEDDTANNVVITADDATLNNVAAGETWSVIGYYIFNASDAAAELLSVDKLVTPLPTNGGNMTVPAPTYPIGRP